MKPFRIGFVAGVVALGLAASAFAQDNKLRLITWADYVPADVVAQFKKETGIDVEVTLSNNEEMISKLRATGGAGFDLAQPSQDRIAGPQQEFGIYKPMDLTKIKTELFIPSMLDATKKNTTVSGRCTGCRTSGVRMASWSIPSSRRCPIIRIFAKRSSRARPACG
jgi:spermidine/putrescine transport system substrate-binding protein